MVLSGKLILGFILHKHPHPQYDKYQDLKKVKQFKIERNNIVWGKNWDLIFDLWDLYEGRSPKMMLWGRTELT